MLATLNGTEIFYEELGRGRGILVMHGGLGFDHTYFRPFLDPLAEQGRLVYYDHRIHGRSGRPPLETLTHEQLVEDAEALRKHLGLGQMVLIGHSYGGFLAQELALRHPNSLAGLVLLCTAPAIDYPEAIMANAQRRGTPEQLAVVNKLFSNQIRTDEELREAWQVVLPLYFLNFDPALAAELDRKGSYSGAALHRAFSELIPRFNVAERLGEIRTPTLVLGGRHDWITPPEQSERLQRGIPGAELVIFEQSGHYPFVEERERFLAVLQGWLKRLPA
jgi:proline iminopeptidase